MFSKSFVLKVIYLLSAALLFDKASFGQLSVSSTTAEEAANYLVGEGVTVSNVSFTGDNLQLAKFSNGNDYLGFNNGVSFQRLSYANYMVCFLICRIAGSI